MVSISIPNSVTTIGTEAFQGCYRLHSIYCLNPIPPTCFTNNTFLSEYLRDKYDVYTYATLHVPMGSKEVYSSAYEWRYFNKIKEDMEMGGKVYYTTLTVQNGMTGYTRQAIKADEKYTIYIGSLGENKVNAITFNGIDVTEEVEDGYYTTPELKKESVLSISYETTTAVNALNQNNVRVTGNNGEITISRIDVPSDAFVYSVDGKLIDSHSTAFGTVSFSVPTGQSYIVKVGSRTYKVAL